MPAKTESRALLDTAVAHAQSQPQPEWGELEASLGYTVRPFHKQNSDKNKAGALSTYLGPERGHLWEPSLLMFVSLTGSSQDTGEAPNR